MINNLPLPYSLTRESTIGIFAPSSAVDTVEFNKTIALLNSENIKTKIHPQTFNVLHSSAGTAQEKANAFHDLLRDPEVDIIIAASGGNRACHFLDLIDFELFKQHPKLVGGFSDVTILLNAIYAKTGISSLHMPTIRSLTKIDQHSFQSIFTGLQTLSWDDAKHLNTGSANGTLLGGTLSMLCAIQGTEYSPNYKGAILFLEDVGEELSRIDRMLWQLKQSLPFKHLNGIIFGEFLNNADTGRPFGFTLDDIIAEHCSNLNIPIIMNAPIGHGTRNHKLEFGREISFKVSEHSARIEYL
jgi:muramoyltetrapeptide carboxypeptidase